MSHDPHREDLPTPSELLALLEIDFEEIGPARVSGSVAADERHHQPWGDTGGGVGGAVRARVAGAIRRGRLPAPPMAQLIGVRLVLVGDGEVRFAWTPDESAYNPIGMVHGGLLRTLLASPPARH